MRTNKYFTALFALPAAAGLLFLAGCGEEEAEVGTVGTAQGEYDMEGTVDPAIANRPPGTVEGRTGENNPGTQINQAVRDQLSEQSEQLQEALNSAAETQDETGAANTTLSPEMLGQANEIADRLQAAIGSGNIANASTAFQELNAMKAQLPPNIQQLLTQIGQTMQALPGAAGVQGAMNGMRENLGGMTPPATRPAY